MPPISFSPCPIWRMPWPRPFDLPPDRDSMRFPWGWGSSRRLPRSSPRWSVVVPPRGRSGLHPPTSEGSMRWPIFVWPPGGETVRGRTSARSSEPQGRGYGGSRMRCSATLGMPDPCWNARSAKPSTGWNGTSRTPSSSNGACGRSRSTLTRTSTRAWWSWTRFGCCGDSTQPWNHGVDESDGSIGRCEPPTPRRNWILDFAIRFGPVGCEIRLPEPTCPGSGACASPGRP